MYSSLKSYALHLYLFHSSNVNLSNIVALTPAAHTPDRIVVEMMTRQKDHLVRMIDDLLDVSRISSGKIEF